MEYVAELELLTARSGDVPVGAELRKVKSLLDVLVVHDELTSASDDKDALKLSEALDGYRCWRDANAVKQADLLGCAVG
jgi:hypothetical protein